MDIKNFSTVAPKLPPDIAILLRGPTGIGKSEIVKGIAKQLGLPYIDVRASTMMEGDAAGYPDIEQMKHYYEHPKTGNKYKCVTMIQPSWFVVACNEPVVLMLDEFNRALPAVMQAFFQVVLDRCLGNDAGGETLKLHPETRVFAAINHGAEYDVNDMDPALLRRFWVTDITPTTKDWLNWAETLRDDGTGELRARIDPLVTEFIRSEPVHLRVDPTSVEPGTVTPSPASWTRANDSLVGAGLRPSDCAGSNAAGFHTICMGFLGAEASISFSTFVEKYDLVLSAEDVLNDYSNKKTQKRLRAAKADLTIGLLEKVGAWLKLNEINDAQAKNIGKWAEKHLNSEQVLKLWGVTSASTNPNVRKIHPYIQERLQKAVSKAQEVKK
jgi:MoxR-like ATPase